MRRKVHGPNGDRGYSLLESLFAVLLVCVAAFPLLEGVTHSQAVQMHREARLDAERILNAEAAKWLTFRASEAPDTFMVRVSESGSPDENGRFTIRGQRSTHCIGGSFVDPPQQSDVCGHAKPIAYLHLSVSFESMIREDGTDSVSTVFTLNHWTADEPPSEL